MAVTVRDNTKNGDQWNEWATILDAKIYDADAQQNKYDDLVKGIVVEKKSKRWGEKSTVMGGLGDYDIKDIEIFDRKDTDGNLLYWGWYSISELRGQIPANNVAYGIRLRCKNIQVGDERTCRNFFLAEGDKRFSQYFFGFSEIFHLNWKILKEIK